MTTEKRYALGFIFGPGRPEMVGYVPHARVLGIRVVETGPGYAVCALPHNDALIGDPQRKVVFGGAITTLVDHTSGLAVACALEELVSIATIDLRVDYLRAARPGVELLARSECYRVTRNVAFIRAVAYEDTPDDPFAGCLGTFMLGANRTENALGKMLPSGDAGGGAEEPSA